MKRTALFILLSNVIILSCQSGFSEKEKAVYTQKGKEIAQATAQYLGGEVKKKMQEGGVAKAAPFCNAQAGNFTDEMSQKYHVTIKRTSHKLRNEDNAPTPEEKAQLTQYQNALKKREKLLPAVHKDAKEQVHVYLPIKVQKKCLACHGIPGETMQHEADSIIKQLYPKDKATGFKEGDLRGMWSITFQK